MDDLQSVELFRTHRQVSRILHVGNPQRAMVWLEQAVGAGFAVADHMARDPDLTSLHGPEFDALLALARENSLKQRGK